jgi:hypothetical protein
VVGTNKSAVADVLGRFTGKTASPSLAATAGLKKCAADRLKPGVFCYLVPPALAKELDAVRKADQSAVNADALAALEFVCNPAAFPVVTGSLAVKADEVSLTVRGAVTRDRPSPLLDLFAGVIAPGHLAGPAAEVATEVTLALPPADRRATSVLAFADACAKAAGTLGPLPSEQAGEASKKLGLDVRDAILSRVAAVTLVLPRHQELPKGVSPLPLVVCHLDSEVAAATLADYVPKLAWFLGGAEKPATPSVETLGGIRVMSLPGTGSPHDAPLHYARQKGVVVFGLDRKWVARTADNFGKEGGRASPAHGVEPAAVIGRFGLSSFARLGSPEPAVGGERVRAIPVPGQDSPPQGTVPSASTALIAALDVLPAASLRIAVGKDNFSAGVAVRWARLQLPALVDKLVLWLERVGIEGAAAEGPVQLIDR